MRVFPKSHYISAKGVIINIFVAFVRKIEVSHDIQEYTIQVDYPPK